MKPDETQNQPQELAAVVAGEVVRYRFEGASQATMESDQLAAEVPVALVYNGLSHAVMMTTPADLEDFARGFSLSERIVQESRQIYGIDVIHHPGEEGIELQIEIASECFAQLRHQRRTLAGRTGCGLCGKDSLQALDMHLPVPVAEESLQVSLKALQKAQLQLAQHQHLNAVTGALHAAAWVSTEGDVLHLREDVGRHNALDKLIGSLAALPPSQASSAPPLSATSLMPQRPQGWLLMSSRTSYELVLKAARAGVVMMASVSAPTALAVKLAEQAGITLAGFLREGGCVVYTAPQRIRSE